MNPERPLATRARQKRARAVGEATTAFVLAFATMISSVEAGKSTAPAFAGEHRKGKVPLRFEPKDLLIETTRQGKSGDL
jgi:hypothetical protein